VKEDFLRKIYFRPFLRLRIPPYNGVDCYLQPCLAGITVTRTYHARIYVTLRPSVLDPAGTAVQSGLQHLGYDNVEQVRIGKYVELMLQADDEATAHSQLDRICDQLLANPVIENYRFELTEVEAIV
jgi:phosphoribosylformylglycinamidine synthase subunit PurS